jgi:gliding motility-associated-like protein
MKNKIIIFLFLILSTRVYGQCTLNAALTTPNPVVCSGIPIDLTITPTGGTAPYKYAWSTGETGQTISVNKAGTYTVTVTDQANCPVIKNITINTGTIPAPPVVNDAIACPGSSAKLIATGPGGIYQWYDENGNFKATGDTYNTPPITAKTVLFVQTTLGGCTSPRTMVTVYPIAAPDAAGGSTCPGSSVTLKASGAGDYEWYDGDARVGTGASFTTPALFATKTYHVVGITAGCTSARVPVQAVVLPVPDAPTIQGPVNTCIGTSVTLTAIAPNNAIFEWYSQPTGGAPLIISPVYTTPILNTTTRYYIQAIINGCIGPRTEYQVTVNPALAAPTVSAPTACAGIPSTLQVTSPIPGGNYRWYATATSTTVLSSAPTFSPTLTAAAQFFVDVEVNGCVSPRTAVNVSVNPTPAAPNVNTVLPICEGQLTTITANGPGSSYNWYQDASGGVALLTNSATFNTPILTTSKSYYVETIVNGCASPRTEVVVTVLAAPLAPTIAGNITLCAGSSTTLTASGTGTTYEWFDAASGGNLVASGKTFTTPILTANTSYFVQISANGCSSTRTSVDITVNPISAGPTFNPVPPVCAGNPALITASGTGTLRWFDVAVGGTLLGTGASYVTPPLSSNTSYWIEADNGTCISPRIRINLTVISAANQFNYSSATYCKTSPNPSPTIAVSGGTFSLSLGTGLVVDPTNGEIDIAASIPGIYEIVYINGCAISTEKIYLVSTTDASFIYPSATYCQSGSDPSPIFTPTSTPGKFSATPAGLVFKSATKGIIDLSASAPGLYTVKNTIDIIGGGCPKVESTFDIRIDPRVVVNAGTAQILAQKTPAQLAGSISGPVTTGTWTTSGTGTFTPNNSALNAQYIPAAGERGTVTLTLTSANPGTSCGPASATIKITFNPKPADPTFSGGTNLCAGNSASLTATGPVADTYDWFTAATGDTAVFTGINFNTPALMATGTTSYYLQATLNGVHSNRTRVDITVNLVPAAPVTAPVVNICYGSAAILSATVAAPGTIAWYSTPVGGAPIFTGGTFTTPNLIANTTYYVQTNNATCESNRTKVDVVLKQIPTITSPAGGEACNGVISYNIESNLPGTTFTWSRLPTPGITNPDLTNQTNRLIAETLVNSTSATVNVTYRVIPTYNGCQGAPFDYVIKVYPTPLVTNPEPVIVCSKQFNPNGFYTALFNTAITDVSWARAAKAGISSQAVSGQRSPTIYESLENTTNAPVDVTYIFTYSIPECATISTFTLTVTVNPKISISSPQSGGEICSGSNIDYEIKSDVPGANFIWRRRADPQISPAPTATTSNRITEILTNTSGAPITVFYDITATTGCLTPFTYSVVIKPQPPKPEAFTNAPICVGSTLYLIPGVTAPGSTYHWTGPKGYTSDAQSPQIPNATVANSGIYTLFVTKNGCTSVGGQTLFANVNEKHIASAGGTLLVCSNATTAQLNGKISGGSTTGLWTLGTGTGSFPDPANLNGIYLPSAADRARGEITLNLASTGQDDCPRAADMLTIKFTKLPGVDAGPDKTVCNQDALVQLNGKMIMAGNGKWTSSSSGSAGFSSSIQVNGATSPTYAPSAADIAAGKVTLTLTADNTTDDCYLPADNVVITFNPPVKINAGPTKYLLAGNTTALTPTVNDPKAKYTWLPTTGLNDPTLKNPIVTGDITRTYTLTVQDSLGCISEPSTVQVIISPKIIIPNTFTPNNDGINDTWDVAGLIAYPNALVDVFDRNGQLVFRAQNYTKPWDGTCKGQALPLGTYYYIIDPKMYGQKYSGYINLVK